MTNSEIELRQYQFDIALEFEDKTYNGERKILLVAPTGSGKTVIASAIIAARPARRVLVVAHRREIVNQTSAKLHNIGVHHGIIQAGDEDKLRPMASVQVASIQTLHARAIRTDSIPMPLADLLVIDEAHHACAKTYQTVIEAYPQATVLGLTATPCRGDGRGLGNIFKTMLQCPQVTDLIELGYLVKSRVYGPVSPVDLKGVKTQAGDWVESQLSERMDKPKLIGDIFTHWHKFGEGRRTLAFACSVSHSIHIRDEFLKVGVRAEHLDGGTRKEDREAILARLASGETEVVTNCMVLTEGFDCPDIGCIILARPTKRMGLYRQMIGRGLRPAEGKTDCVILDHSGAWARHGLPEDRVAWTLEEDTLAVAPEHQKRQGSSHTSLLECSQCGAIRVGGLACIVCGHLPKRPGKYKIYGEGELGLVEKGKANGGYTPEDKDTWHRMLLAICQNYEYKPGWAAYKFKTKFGHWPPRGEINPVTPNKEVMSWVRAQMIAYAKAKEKHVEVRKS